MRYGQPSFPAWRPVSKNRSTAVFDKGENNPGGFCRGGKLVRAEARKQGQEDLAFRKHKPQKSQNSRLATLVITSLRGEKAEQ